MIDTELKIGAEERAAAMSTIVDLVTGKSQPQTPEGMQITGATIELRGIGLEEEGSNNRLYYEISVSQITGNAPNYKSIVIGIPTNEPLSPDAISIGWGIENALSHHTLSSLEKSQALLAAAFANMQPTDESVRLDRIAMFHLQPQSDRRSLPQNLGEANERQRNIVSLSLEQLALHQESPLHAVTGRLQRAMQQ